MENPVPTTTAEAKGDTDVTLRCKRMRGRRTLQRHIWGSMAMIGAAVCCWMSGMGVIAVAPATEEPTCDSPSDVCAKTKPKPKTSEIPNTCKLYMAPTTVGGIKGNYGIFTAVDLPAGATVLANDGPNIPVMLDERNFPSKIFPDTDHMGLFNNVWWGLGTTSDEVRSQYLSADKEIVTHVDLQINFGALPNCHPYRPNIESSMPLDGIDYDDRRYLTGDHVRNPLRGSFSYFTGKFFGVTQPVAAGTELFLDYTADWEQHGFPRTQDYFSAAALVRKWIYRVEEEIYDRKEEDFSDMDPSAIIPIREVVDGAKSLLELTRVFSPAFPLDGEGMLDADFHNEDTIEKGVYQLEQLTSRVLSVLPQSTEEWDKVYRQSWELYFRRKQRIQSQKNLDPPPPEGHPDFPSVKDVADAMYEVSKPPPKSNQELQDTGICLDHIVAGPSMAPLELETASGERIETTNMTIGRGAIAARFLAKGELVVPVPFLHLLDRSLFEKYQGGGNEYSFAEMILNYCFGNSESTLIMCPVTNAVLVNHCSDRNGRFSCGGKGGEKGPNAEYRWASDSEWDQKTKHTLNMTLDDLAGTNHKQQHRMMSMEIVATRDIQEGEEIFIDYGEKWEEAWLEHVRNWANQDDDTDPLWSSRLTSFELNHGGLMTAEEQEHEQEDPLFYGDLRGDEAARSNDGRFMAVCWYQDLFYYADGGLGSRHSWDPDAGDYDDNEDDDDERISNIYWRDLSNKEIYDEYAIDVGKDRTVQFTHFKDRSPGSYGHFWPCSILSKKEREEGDDDDEDRYLVRIYPSDYHYHFYGEEWLSDSAEHVLLKNYPRSSIRFVLAPYKGDQYHPKAFRHHIEVKDEIFPEQWKNRK